MWGLIFLIFILGFLLIPLSVENSFGDNIKTRTSAFPHADLTEQPERNAQQTPHDDLIEWKKGKGKISYIVDEDWKFLNNNLRIGLRNNLELLVIN